MHQQWAYLRKLIRSVFCRSIAKNGNARTGRLAIRVVATMEDPSSQSVEQPGTVEDPPPPPALDQSASESLLDSTADSGPSQRRPPPPPSPLTGCYLLIIIGEPHSERHKEIILQKISKGKPADVFPDGNRPEGRQLESPETDLNIILNTPYINSCGEKKRRPFLIFKPLKCR